MNMSTTRLTPTCGAAAWVSMCFCAVPPNSARSVSFVAASRCPPGLSRFIMSRPSATPTIMLAKKNVNVRPASGPSFLNSPS